MLLWYGLEAISEWGCCYKCPLFLSPAQYNANEQTLVTTLSENWPSYFATRPLFTLLYCWIFSCLSAVVCLVFNLQRPRYQELLLSDGCPFSLLLLPKKFKNTVFRFFLQDLIQELVVNWLYITLGNNGFKIWVLSITSIYNNIYQDFCS